jgi:hypothetical protein
LFVAISPSYGLAFSMPRSIHKFALVSHLSEASSNPPFSIKFRVYQPKIYKKFNIIHRYTQRSISGKISFNKSILIGINKIFLKKNS